MTNLAGIELSSAVIAASGTCGYVDELADVMPLERLGAVVTKSITREPRQGNPTWRILDAPNGMLNAIGLANVGLDAFVRDKLLRASDVPTVVIGSIAGGSVSDYVAVAEAFETADALPAAELNVSCPNTDDGLMFGESPTALRELLTEVRAVFSSTRMFVKLSPNVGDISALAQVAVECGADGLTLINTLHGMAIDVDSRKPRLSTTTGGYSGPAIHPVALRMVHQVYRDVARDANVPIIGLGGVMSWRDAAEFVLAGATAVGIGTGLFVNPRLPVKIGRGLERWVAKAGCTNLRELVGQIDAA